jgi:hypothetical protein
MPLSPKEVKDLEELEGFLTKYIDPDSDTYDTDVKTLEETSNSLDIHYGGVERKVDENGKLLEAPATRMPAEVTGPPDAPQTYFFEPNVREVQAFLRKNPQALDRLGLRPWAETVRTEEVRSPVIDNNAIVGYNILPAQTGLDLLQEDTKDPESPYNKAVGEMYRLAMEDAQKNGRSLKRYRDVKLNKNEWQDYVHGGITKAMQRVVAPALLSAADASTAGQASPLGDALTDLADYTLARTKVNFGDPYGIGDQGLDLEELVGPQPRSEEVMNRNMPVYVGAGFAAGGLPRNPTNAVARGVTEAVADSGLAGAAAAAARSGSAAAADIPAPLGMRAFVTPLERLDTYRHVDPLWRAGSSAVSGAVSNAGETFGRDLAQAASQNVSPGDYQSVEDVPAIDFDARELGNAAATAAGNVPLNSILGFGIGGTFDLAGQGVGGVREAYRSAGRNRALPTFEQAGGEASMPMGVSPPREITDAKKQLRRERNNPKVAPTTVAGRLSGELAPTLERAAKADAVANQANIKGQMDEYYTHPAYNEKTVNAKPAVEGLVALAQSGLTRRQSSTGKRAAMYPDELKRIGKVLREYSEPNSVPKADAPSMAHESNGVVVDGELANQLYGFEPGDTGYIRPGHDAVIRAHDINAQNLTTLERRIYDELNMASGSGRKHDPIWDTLDKNVKELRDQFPLYRDENGKLVPPPPESARPEPFAKDPGAVPPKGEMKVEAPPIEVKGGPPRKPEGLMGVGPGQPALPNGPFDPRAGKPQPKGGVDVMPQPIGVGGEGMVARPEGLYAVGPGGPPIPENPFDPRLPVSRERLSPAGQMNVQGGEYGPPPPLDPNARMGVGDRFNPEPVNPFNNNLDFVSQGGSISPQQTQQVQGTYNRPPEVRPEPVPQTQRNPYAFAQRGEPPHETPLPPSNRIEPQPDPNASPEEMAMRQHEIDDFLRKDREINAADDRGGLEKMLDQQLEKAPKADQKEIDEIGAEQTADREEVAQNWRDVNELFSKDRKARAAEVEKVKVLSENREVIEEAINQVNEIERRLGGEGGLPQEQKRNMVISAIEQKLGRKIDAEDLIRFGLISAGAVQMATSDDEDSASVGAGIFGLGLGRLGKKKAPPEPTGPKKPTQPEFEDDQGVIRRGFSAMRAQQHEGTTAIEKMMKRLGVEGDNTLEGRIRTYGQNNDREKIDQALLDQANKIGKGDALRRAAGANAYETLKDRAWFGGDDGLFMKIADAIGLRGYRAGEYFAGRHAADTPRDSSGIARNPFVAEPTTLLGDMQRTLLEDPARRLLDLTGGAAAGRLSNDVYEHFKGSEKYVSKEEDEKKKRKSASP